jgi:hypothetical protein
MASFAYLAQGKLFVKRGGEPPQAYESAFGQGVRERAIQIQKRHEWKTAGRGANFMSRGLLWGGPGKDPEAMLIAATHLSRGLQPDELLYALSVEGRTAVCALRLEDGVERRLLHGSERRLADLHALPGGEQIVCSAFHADGTASLALMGKDAAELVEVTEGESQDGAPSFCPGPGRRIVYHSAGVGRDGAGRPTGLGPSEIHLLDLDQGQLETLASDPRCDLLWPRLTPDGALHYVSRPWRTGEGAGFWRSSLDFLLFPARLLFAVFQYLNYFSARYTGKPLTTAGGPRREGADVRQMMVWSNLLGADEAASAGEEPPPDVPRSWRLLRRAPNGETAMLAEGVLSFDLCRDGSLLYSTGTAVYRLAPDGKRERLLADAGIRQVVSLE